jgi:CHASE2 domain-containing sensor protein/class 3 adenylate cyclase
VIAPVLLKRQLSRLRQAYSQYQYQIVVAAIVLAVSLGITGLRSIGFLESLELKGLDYLFGLRPAEKPDDRIVIVEISEQDIQRQARWPWSDAIFANLIAKIAAAKPSIIGIDKYLDLPVGEGRTQLVRSMKNAGNVVNITFLANGGRGVDLAADLAEVSDAGFANVITDPGAIVRRALLALDDDSFALLLARRYLEKTAGKNIDFKPETKEFSIDGRVIPRIRPRYGGYSNIDANGYQVPINYRGKEKTFTRISSVDLLDGKVDPARLRDRIVLIGTTAVSLKDSYPTPFSTGEEVMYGVEIHANIASQIVSAALDRRPFIQVWSEQWEYIWIAAWTIVGGSLALFARRVSQKPIALAAIVSVLAGLVYWAFLLAWWIPFFPALFGLAGANILVILYQLGKEQADRNLLMGLFSRHVSKDLVDLIWERRTEFLNSGRILGQEVYVTVMFSDMRNFSSCAEVQSPSETMMWLNEYLGAIASEVLKNGGMVDKYIGDAVMAVFGVPISHGTETERSRDAQSAVETAIIVAEKLEAMSKIWQARGLPETVTGIGINSGIAIAGSLGSSDRLEYSVLGDTVNIAARLESLNKEVDGGAYHILISQDTRDRLEGKFRTELVGKYALKGRTMETPVYRVLGR